MDSRTVSMSDQLLPDFVANDLKIQLNEASLILNEEPPSSLSTLSRFPTPLSNEDFTKSIGDRIPQNTKYANNWALSIWHEWRMWRNFTPETRKDIHWPIPDLKDGNIDKLEY
jgi:hypothetical protein